MVAETRGPKPDKAVKRAHAPRHRVPQLTANVRRTRTAGVRRDSSMDSRRAMGLVLASVLAAGARAAEPQPVLGYFVDDEMKSSSGACELTVLRSHDQQSAALLQGGTGASCEVVTEHVTDLLIRCGEYRRYTTTPYDLNAGITAVMVVYTAPARLAKDWEVELGKFDAEYERRALYEEGRRDLHEYWLSLSHTARRQVKRACALLLAPTGGTVHQAETWFE